jgi:hypothetical protein
MYKLNAFELVLKIPWKLLGACGHLWVILNSLWTPIECAWMPMSEWEQPLNNLECTGMPWSEEDTHWVCVNAIELLLRKNTFVWELNSPWVQLSVHKHLWARSEYWTPHECFWVHMNTFEYPLNAIECPQILRGVWTATEHPLSVHECL